MERIVDAADLEARTGTELGVSDWFEVTQTDVSAFAELTGDEFWIHTDPERAASSRFGGTIAHGLYTLSLEPRFRYELVTFAGWPVQLNYGYGRVRFPAPLPVGSRIRMRSILTDAHRASSGWRVTLEQIFEREGGDRPACVAEAILHLFDDPGD
jgi:acyl dehydratase